MFVQISKIFLLIVLAVGAISCGQGDDAQAASNISNEGITDTNDTNDTNDTDASDTNTNDTNSSDTNSSDSSSVGEAVIAKKGAVYKFYQGLWSDDLDLNNLEPLDSRIVSINVKGEAIPPAEPGDSFVVLEGYFKAAQAGTYSFNPGYRNSTFNIMTVNGQQVYRKNVDEAQSQFIEIPLSIGLHPFRIVYIKGINPFSIWHERSGTGLTRMDASHLWHMVPITLDMERELSDALDALQAHIDKVSLLTDTEINQQKAILEKHKEILGSSEAMIKASLDLVASYDMKVGPLWIARPDFNRNQIDNDLDWTIYHVMQYIMDYVYVSDNVSAHANLLDGYKFQSSSYFPGNVDAPTDSTEAHSVAINGSYKKEFGHTTQYTGSPARKPTGTYLAPGSIASITVPEALVGKGYMVRVGAHSWDFSKRKNVKRLDRSSLLYPINSTEVDVASPLGGGIYIEVPYFADEGVVDIEIKNAVRAPYFSAKDFHRTTLAQWQTIERQFKAPWADFQSEKFMLNVPTSWIYNLEDPVSLMDRWDDTMDAINDLMGYPRDRQKETMFPQVDLQLRSAVHTPGYPSVNTAYKPLRDYGGNHGNHLLSGPKFKNTESKNISFLPDVELHEQGHSYLFTKFPGESESNVNLHHVAAMHTKFGFTLDEAFRSSRGFNKNTFRTLDNTAVTWMTSLNFTKKKPMHTAEKSYQLKGHAKFVELVRLFGWQGLNDFWRSFHLDKEQGINSQKDIDSLILRLSKTVGVDVTPLLHFWGVHPQDAVDLKFRISQEGLSSSAKIYDALVSYQSLVPTDNVAFREYVLNWYGRQPSVDDNWTASEHAKQWDNASGQIYDEVSYANITAVIDELIASYFPNGRP